MQKLNESVKNLLDEKSNKLKIKYTDQVWDILQEAYKSQGGIKGSGFKSKEDMLNIPFWKLDIVDEKILCVLMYKYTPTDTIDGNVRKLCALGIVSDEDKSIGRIKLKNILKEEFKRSILEISGLMEQYIMKNFPVEYKQYMLTTEEVEKILVFDDIEPIDKHRYYRIIGDEFYEKVMIGTIQRKY